MVVCAVLSSLEESILSAVKRQGDLSSLEGHDSRRTSFMRMARISRAIPRSPSVSVVLNDCPGTYFYSHEKEATL